MSRQSGDAGSGKLVHFLVQYKRQRMNLKMKIQTGLSMKHLLLNQVLQLRKTVKSPLELEENQKHSSFGDQKCPKDLSRQTQIAITRAIQLGLLLKTDKNCLYSIYIILTVHIHVTAAYQPILCGPSHSN